MRCSTKKFDTSINFQKLSYLVPLILFKYSVGGKLEQGNRNNKTTNSAIEPSSSKIILSKRPALLCPKVAERFGEWVKNSQQILSPARVQCR